ncbi:MAG TPA: hypothetical protein VE622_00055 [Nitrososphaeraceae archaeon]|jgi:hypothetical protein|nr:hypothetical protein [Nitrososphaeraceae archaeon]
MTNYIIIDNGKLGYSRVLFMIKVKQNGLCRFCRKKIDNTDIIVIKGSHQKRKYYHKECAERLNIL